MRIRSVRHRGLRNLILRDDVAGLPQQFVGKIRNIIAFLQDMEHVEELQGVSVWRAHALTGDRKGTWSLFVSRNWRITFRIDQDTIEIIDLNYEDYH